MRSALLTAALFAAGCWDFDALEHLYRPDAAFDLSVADATPPPPDLAPALSKCPLAGALCDGFEAGIAPFWTLHQRTGTLTADTTRFYRGNHSLHIHVDSVDAGADNSDTRLSEQSTLSNQPADVYVRAFYYLPSPTVVNPVQLFSMNQLMTPFSGVGVVLQADGTLAAFDTVSGQTFASSSTALPLDRWTCLTWHVHLDTNDLGVVEVALDGKPIAMLHLTQATQTTPAEGEVSVGALFVAPTMANPTTDVWIDEVAIGTAPIGCAD